MYQKECIICNKKFSTIYPNKQTCSKTCDLKKRKEYYKKIKLKHKGFCLKCGEEKPLLKKNHTWCEACFSKERYKNNPFDKRKKQANIKNRLIKLKLVSLYGKKECFYCKINNLPLPCYDFHHLDPSKKDFFITNEVKSLKHLIENENYFKNEINKCVLTCANCHRLIHSFEYKNNPKKWNNIIKPYTL